MEKVLLTYDSQMKPLLLRMHPTNEGMLDGKWPLMLQLFPSSAESGGHHDFAKNE